MWVKLDDQMLNHPKIAAVGALGFAMHVAGIVYCGQHLTDGFVPRGAALHLLNFEGVGIVNGTSGRDADCLWIIEQGVVPYVSLVEAGLWITQAGGWDVHDYLEYNFTREKVLVEREKTRVRVADFRARRKPPTPGNDVTSPVSNDEVTLHPYPSLSELHPPTTESRLGLTGRAEEVLKSLTATEREHSGPVRNRTAWERKVGERLTAEHAPRIAELIARYPDAPPDVIAGALNGEGANLRYYTRTDP